MSTQTNVNWTTSNYFKEPFIQIGWDLTKATNFPHVSYLGADTETKVYYNKKVLVQRKS